MAISPHALSRINPTCFQASHQTWVVAFVHMSFVDETMHFATDLSDLTDCRLKRTRDARCFDQFQFVTSDPHQHPPRRPHENFVITY